MPSNSTCTPASIGLTPPPALRVKLAAGDGPRLVPLMAINSPGVMGPEPLVALLMMNAGCGTGTAVIPSVTVTTRGVVSTPGAVIVTVPLRVLPAAVPAGMFCGFTETLIDLGVAPLVVSMAKQLPALAAAAEKFTGPPLLESARAWAAGADPAS